MKLALLFALPLLANATSPFGLRSPSRHRNCQELLRSGDASADGVYVIYPYDSCPERPVRVFCDMTTDGGGWTVIQRRGNYEQQQDFYKTFTEYSLGFGDPSKDHWLGLDHIHALASQSNSQIRFDLADFEGTSKWAKYDFFYVHDKQASYQLEVNGYSGDAGDSFSGHSGYRFSTKDHDVDSSGSSCSERFDGAWWYNKCHSSNLNGLYLRGPHESYANGVNWSAWRGYYYSLKSTVMMLRPNF